MIETDDLAAWPLIIQRLKTEVPELRDVLMAYDLADVLNGERTPVSNSAYVIFDDEEGFVDVAGEDEGTSQIINQSWVVMLIVQNARNASAGRGPADDAGTLRVKIRKALAGWQPAVDIGPLIRVRAAKPFYRAGGFGYFPLRFLSQIITCNDE